MTKLSANSFEASYTISRQQVVDLGTDLLFEIGSEHLCKVCIANNGSCCIGCKHLVEGIGCGFRNTSCTAWLCGFLKYVLYETGQLQAWEQFWDQVPGQGYREDFTPDQIEVDSILSLHTISHLSKALSEDLQEIANAGASPGFILTLREKLDRYIDFAEYYTYDSEKQKNYQRMIESLSKPFHRFHSVLQR